MNTNTLTPPDSSTLSLQQCIDASEASRVLGICNACRYCEGFCPVFPAMARRLSFEPQTLHYLANLCHNCGACLHACQYAPPHEFGVQLPQALARMRAHSYAHYAWPGALARLYQHNGLVLALALAFGLATFLLLALALNGSLWPGPLAGNFYAVFPHGLLVSVFGSVFGLALLALGVAARRFWREQKTALAQTQLGATGAVPTPMPTLLPTPAFKLSLAEAKETAWAALRLQHLDGGHGQGCAETDDRPSLWRRRFHHATFYGFMLCLGSTSVATLYHYWLGWPAPYPLTSLPVLLGTVGGLGLLVGPLGLAYLHSRRPAGHTDPQQAPMDLGFIALLALTSASGLALLYWRDSAAMAVLLALHLGIVMALFLTLPYSKFTHGLYRSLALALWAWERRRPSRVAAES